MTEYWNAEMDQYPLDLQPKSRFIKKHLNSQFFINYIIFFSYIDIFNKCLPEVRTQQKSIHITIQHVLEDIIVIVFNTLLIA